MSYIYKSISEHLKKHRWSVSFWYRSFPRGVPTDPKVPVANLAAILGEGGNHGSRRGWASSRCHEVCHGNIWKHDMETWKHVETMKSAKTCLILNEMDHFEEAQLMEPAEQNCKKCKLKVGCEVGWYLWTVLFLDHLLWIWVLDWYIIWANILYRRCCQFG